MKSVSVWSFSQSSGVLSHAELECYPTIVVGKLRNRSSRSPTSSLRYLWLP
jgi:hypothetical protein